MSEWKKVKLADVCDFIKGETGIAKADAGEYLLVVTGKERKTCDSFQFDTKAVCIPLVSSTGHGKASLNYVHYQEGKFALGTILVAVIPRDENVINPQFLHLYLSRLKDSLLVPLMKGTANVSLSVALIKNIEISVPKIERQIQIVNLFNQIDLEHQELSKENTNQQIYLTKLRQAILQEAIEGKLTADWRVKNPVEKGNPNTDAAALLATIKAEKQKLIAEGKIKKEKPLAPINPGDVPFALPDGWVWTRLGEVSQYGFPEKVNSNKEILVDTWVLDMEDIEKNTSRLINRVLSDSRVIQSTKTKFKKGDVLFGKLRPYLNKVLVADLDGVCTTEIVPIRGYCEIDPEYIKFVLKSRLTMNRVSRLMGGVKMPRLGTNDAITLNFPLPPLAEQHAIVERVDSLMAAVNTLEQQVKERKIYAEQLMQAVLKKAFAG